MDPKNYSFALGVGFAVVLGCAIGYLAATLERAPRVGPGAFFPSKSKTPMKMDPRAQE